MLENLTCDVINCNTNVTFSKIMTHNGCFHADEITSIAILKLAGYNCNIIRTRNGVLNDCLAVDVGGEFNPDKAKFDHHQRTFDKYWHATIDGIVYDVPMASAGLIWCYYGKQAIVNLLGKLNDKDIDILYNSILHFVFCIDAVDTGKSSILGSNLQDTYSSIISQFNHTDAYNESIQTEWFNKVVDFAKNLITKKLLVAFNSISYNHYLEECVSRQQGPILELEKAGPWVDYVLKNWDDCLKYSLCLFKSNDTDWRVQSFPNSKEDRMSMRCPAPEDIRGLRGNTLEKATNIKDVTFVHAAGFIGGATNRDSALELAKFWLVYDK